MPSFGFHIAVANKVAEKIKVDKNDFLFGNILPDVFNGFMLTDYKIIPRVDTHYGKVTGVPLPDPEKFLQEHGIENDVKLGYYVHLLADFYFNKHTIDKFGDGRGNSEKQNDCVKFSDEMVLNSYFAMPQYSENISKNSPIEITDEEVKMVERYFLNFRTMIANEPKREYQIFSREELNVLLDEIVGFIMRGLENDYSKVNNR